MGGEVDAMKAWHCDFPGCSKVTGFPEEKGWLRMELFPRWGWVVCSIPVIGNLFGLAGLLSDYSEAYMCPEHGKAIFPYGRR